MWWITSEWSIVFACLMIVTCNCSILVSISNPQHLVSDKVHIILVSELSVTLGLVSYLVQKVSYSSLQDTRTHLIWPRPRPRPDLTRPRPDFTRPRPRPGSVRSEMLLLMSAYNQISLLGIWIITKVIYCLLQKMYS